MHINTSDLTTSDSPASAAWASARLLDPEQRATLLHPYSRAAAANWSNFPQGYLGHRGRIGLRTATLSPAQWNMLEALLAAATGSGRGRGFDAIRQHLDVDDHLHAKGAGPYYGRGNFFIAFIGDPSDTDMWQVQFGGHHLALSNSYHRGTLVGATPSFRGIEPFPSFTTDGKTFAPMERKRAAIATLLQSLDRNQLQLSQLRGSWPDILLGPGDDDSFPAERVGLAGNRLTLVQSDLLIAAISEWVHDIDDASATRILVDYAAQLDRTHLAYAGSTRVDSPGDYVRIDGPRVWIEFSMHGGVVLSAPHPHTVWRDRLTDYGGPAFHSLHRF